MTTFLEKIRVRLRLGSLTVKVIIGVCLILILVMGLFTYYDMVSRVKYHLKQQEELAYEISDTVMRSIEYPMLDGEMEDVQAILENLIRLKDVTVVDLCDTKGTIMYSGSPANIGNVDDSEVTKRALRTSTLLKGLEMVNGEKVLHHAMPIPNEQTCHKCHGAEKKILGVLTVGISWTPIENRIEALRNREITLGIVSVIVVGFFLTLFLSKYITRPLGKLTQLADEISRGNPGAEFGRILKCWEVEHCDKTDCPAYENTDVMCWYVDGTHCKVQPSGQFPEKLDMCRNCAVYKGHVGDEMVRLADSFKHMLHRLKVFEKELGQSEEKYRLLFDTNPNPIFILDHETFGIIDANARAESFYGYSKEELLKMPFTELGYEEDAEEIMLDFKNVVGQQSILSPKKRHRRKDGGLSYLNIHVCHAKYMGKDALIATTTDVTESIQKEAQLTQASKMATLGEMATGVAHELNQPLSAIQIGADFFRNMVRQGREIPGDEMVTISEQMGEQVARAVGIINHLREFGRKAEIQPEKVDINQPLNGVFTLLSQQLKLRGIKVRLNLKENLPPIMGDSNRLEQVFIDLIINSRDSMEEKQNRAGDEDVDNILTVSSFQEDGQVVVTINDTGLGISDEAKSRIFEPFFTTKEVGKGTGLGLSISYGIVKDYNGTIEVESEIDKGTTFRITFPACEEKKGRV
ncbi:MAG: PAS domain S-box protein [Deltaproteobacteria bacterium]|nr:PAS domain S-box protein [Deltaproteobacteria bacterium]